MSDPPKNPQIKQYFSDNIVKETDDSGGQTSLKIMFDKQTPEEVRGGILSQALLASIRSLGSAIGSIDSGSGINPNVANVIYDTLLKAAMVINTDANVGSLGSDILVDPPEMI